jgi:hypothetical protein
MSALDAAKIEEVREAVSRSKGVCWDGCHEIFILLDEEQVNQSLEWGYEVFLVFETNADMRANMLLDWYYLSCPLRFISTVSTVDGDPNEGYEDIVPQFEYTDAEDIEEDE